MTKLTILRLKW